MKFGRLAPLAVAAALLLALPALAPAQGRGYGWRQNQGPMRNQDRVMRNYNPNLLSVERLQDQTVHNRQGEELGEIEALVLTPDRSQISYVVLGLEDGFLGLGEQEKAIPWSAFRFRSARDGQVDVMLPVSEQQLNNAVSFEDDDEYVGDELFIEDVYAPFVSLGMYNSGGYGYGYGYGYGEDGGDYGYGDYDEEIQPWHRELGNVIGSEIQDRDGDEVGEIEDVIVEASTGHLAYVIADVEDDVFEDLDYEPEQEQAVIPWNALLVSGDDYLLPYPPQALARLTFDYDAAGVRGLENPRFMQHVHQVLNVRPFWHDVRQQQMQTSRGRSR